tara:strand:- start:413 stop:1249 length:837 start_codon:yes stop_codon:yes gene_type:complete
MPKLGLGLGVVGVGTVSSLDPDAAAYIALLEGDGVSVSGAQKSAIDAFYTTGKDEGWYSKLKRFYFPVWNAAAPSARCLVSGTSGTFSGTIGHNSGFVTGNGTNTHFDTGATPSAMGIPTGDALLLRGIHLDNNSVHDACGVAATPSTQSLGMLNFAVGGNFGTTYFRQPSSAAGAQITGQANYRGIYVGSCTATNSRFLLKRTTSGTTVVTNAATDSTAIYDQNPHFLARRLATVSNRTKGSEFAWGLGNGLTQAQAEDCSLAIKTLWETVTGLTLA